LEIVASDSGELELSRNQVRARTRHPLTIGENNELIVTRPDGTTKIVTVLPDTAAAKMREQGFAQLDNDVELDVEGDQPVYRFATRRVRRLLGLFPTEFTGETSVSAETGEIVGTASTEVTLFRRFLETLSF
jgi:hypothetical protein